MAPMEIDCHETSAAAFVDGGIQDACNDACSICLDSFSESDLCAVTNCNHRYHLQCILEWCQRSSNCPMCWRQVSLKERTSQELLEAVENEKKMRARASRREFQFPAITNEAEIEERILQHLAAAMGSQYQFPRRGDRGGSSSLGGHSRFIVFSPATAPPGRAVSSSLVLDGNENERATIPVNASLPLPNDTDNISNHRHSTGQASVEGNETGSSSSEFQGFSDSVRSRFSSFSMRRYRESILRSTRSWKERLFAHSNSFSDLGSEDRRDGRNCN